MNQAQAVQISILLFVISAKAGIRLRWKFWIPAVAGMMGSLLPMSSNQPYLIQMISKYLCSSQSVTARENCWHSQSRVVA